MNGFDTDILQTEYGIFHLGSAYNGVVAEKQPFAVNLLLDRNQLHFGDQIAERLILRHETPGPCRGVLDERTVIGFSGGVGVTDGVGDSRVGDTADGVNIF